MEEDSYSSTASPSESPTDEKPMEEKDDGDTTALLPKSILAGKEFKPGEEVILRIVHDYGDQIEVEYATEKKGMSGDESETSMASKKMGDYATEE